MEDLAMRDSNVALQIIEEVRPGADAHIRANRLPVMTETDNGNLDCGKCGEAIAEATSPASFHRKIQTDQRLIVECTCGALNVVPSP
jgi:hypothetical protein